MKPAQFVHPARAALRGLLFVAVFLGLFAGAGGVQTAHAITTGTISGTVYMADGVTPITDASIGVQARDTSGNTWNACSNPANGQYTITGIPLGRAVKVIADGSSIIISVTRCTNSRYGYEIWNHVTVWETATPITLSLIHPNRIGIDFTLGDAVPYMESFYFNMDSTSGILDDIYVRQAIAYGTNRQAMLDDVWGPNGTLGTVQDSYVPDNAFNAAKRSDGLPGYDYNAGTAAGILQAHDWLLAGDGWRYNGTTRLTLSFKTTTAQLRQDTGALFVSQMAAIGIEVIATYIDPTTFFGATGPLATGNFDIVEYAYSNCASSLDEACVPYSMFYTGDSGNTARYNSVAADTDYNNAQANTPPGRAYWSIQHQIQVMTDLPTLPLFTRALGSISGVVRKMDGTPLTGLKIRVEARNAANGNSIAEACTNPANGYYVLIDIPAGVSIAVYAEGNTECSSNASMYGWSYWNELGDVSDISDATPVLLTGATPVRGGIDLTLGEAVPGIEYLAFNLDSSTNGILADQAVRHAIAYGMNRLYILDHAWLPNSMYGTVENSYVAGNHWAKVPDASLPIYAYNAALAQSTLDAAGWLLGDPDGIRRKGGTRLSITFKTTTAAARQAAGALFVDEMKAIGIEILPTYIDPGTFFDPTGPLATRSFDIAEYAIAYCRNTLDETCVPFAMYRTGDVNNAAGYSSTAADAEYDAFQAITGTDPTAHAERLTHAFAHQIIAMEDLPYLPLFTRVTPLTIRGNAGVGGARLSWEDGTPKYVNASSLGNYSITVPYGWTGADTPTKAGRVFTPASRSYTQLTSSRSAQNFTAKYIATYRSTGSQDGWILESRETSGVGGTLNAAATTFPLGDDIGNRQYRAVLSFNTAGLPDTAVIQSAVIKIEPGGPPTGTDPFTILGKLRVDLGNPFLGTGPALELADFNALPKLAAAGTFGSLPSKGWYSAALTKSASGAINKIGLTQFRLYFSLDDNNNHVADTMPFFSGNALTADRPTLTIIYTLP